MHPISRTLLAALAVVLLSSRPATALDVGSDGLSGQFNPQNNTQATVDLSLAVNGDLSTPGNPNGVYDKDRWVIIFKYSSVNIPSGVTVTFKNHKSGAPVVWLVQGSVNISGLVKLSGEDAGANAFSIPSIPGPGGFGGGTYQSVLTGGMGPGGGINQANGHYASVYGNPEILPLIGGSGGSAAGCGFTAARGGAGGGAILIASNQTISLATNGVRILSNGGQSAAGCGAGSGGAVRLLAEAITGPGSIIAAGGNSSDSLSYGRIRVEANSVSIPNGAAPSYSVQQPLTGNELLFPAPSAPTIWVQAIDGQPVPADLEGEQSPDADLSLSVGGPVTVDVMSTNIPLNATVKLRVIPRTGTPQVLTVPSNGPNAWRITNVQLPISGVALFQATAVLP